MNFSSFCFMTNSDGWNKRISINAAILGRHVHILEGSLVEKCMFFTRHKFWDSTTCFVFSLPLTVTSPGQCSPSLFPSRSARRHAEPGRSGRPPVCGSRCHLAQLCRSWAARLLTCQRRELGAREGSVSRLGYWGGGARDATPDVPPPGMYPSCQLALYLSAGRPCRPPKGTVPRPRHAFLLFSWFSPFRLRYPVFCVFQSSHCL